MLRFILLHRIELTDRHPALMLALTIAAMCLASAIDPSVPQ